MHINKLKHMLITKCLIGYSVNLIYINTKNVGMLTIFEERGYVKA